MEDKDGTADVEEESQGVAGLLNNLIIETGGTEEEAIERLKAALGMDVEGGGKNDEVSERE